MTSSKRYASKSAEPRRREPRKLGDVLPQLMARRGYNRLIAHEIYLDAWQAIAGPLYQHSRPGLLRRGVLEIIAANSTIVQELTFQKRRLISAMSEQLPDQKISDLRFVVGKID